VRALDRSAGVAVPCQSRDDGSVGVGELGRLKAERPVERILSAMSAFASMAASTRSRVVRKEKGGEARRCQWEEGRA